jgi:hypothetical protein
MASTPHPITTAFWTYIIPMTSTRAWKFGIVLTVLFAVCVVLLYVLGFLASDYVSDALMGMRHFLIMVGVPVGAVILSEMPIRDGITHKTLLYPLLGPVSRTTLVVTRIVVTGAILAVGSSLMLLLIRALLGDGFGFFPRELLSVFLGSFVYVALFGFIHLYNRRGLIAGLVILFVFDKPLGMLPFSLRNISPSYHMGVISNQQEGMDLPIRIGAPASSEVVSVFVLLGILLVFSAAIAYGFKKKDLGDIC